ncbi:gas vesicle protein K [Conexibacter arvalis]|uniref:gas vesicle protein K n=1 Tax=Conexibacter arvalis TaxID=912552 RepID=UPI0031B5B063
MPARAARPARAHEPEDGPPTEPVARVRPTRLDADEDDLARGLGQLVLTIVELLRQLMERQAIRRVEAGGLDEDEVERLGRALLALERQMDELKETFGLTDEDLNLDLGPLGRLL